MIRQQKRRDLEVQRADRGQRVMPASKLPGVGTTIFTVMSRLAAETGAINLGQGFPDFDPPARLRELVAQHLARRPQPVRADGGTAGALRRDRRGRGAPAWLAHRSRRRDHGHRRRHRGAVRRDPRHRARGRGGGPARSRATTPTGPPRSLPARASCACRSRSRTSASTGSASRPRSGRARASWSSTRRSTRPGRCCRPRTGSGSRICSRARDAFVLSDEVYEALVFDGRRHAGVLGNARLRDRAFAVFSFGKTYNATGWKVGYCVAAPPLTAEFRKVHQFLTFAVSTPVQHAIADFMREVAGIRGRTGRRSTRRGATASQDCSKARDFVLRPVHGTYFQLADYSAVSGPAGHGVLRGAGAPARRGGHSTVAFLRRSRLRHGWCVSVLPSRTRPWKPRRRNFAPCERS